MTPTDVEDILGSWFGAPGSATHGRTRPEWFRKRDDFDDALRARFLPVVEAAERGGLDDWMAPGDARRTLAFILVCDQFPRNLFRDSARAFALDDRALAAARGMVARGDDLRLLPVERWFVYLPFEHAEDMDCQRESLRLFGLLRGDPDAGEAFDWAVKHAEVIARFGRYPHRNALLGRPDTPEEAAFLRQPGSRF